MVDLVPVDHEPEFTEADQAAMQPETFVPPFLSDWVKQAAPKDVDILKKTAQPIINAMMAPGQALASTTPITSADMIKPAADIARLTTLGAGAVPAEANSLRMGIKAYHGSPHDFDAFDLSKIGTGEGAQAYGHGLYFADAEKVAEQYRNKLSDAGYARVNGGLTPKEEYVYDKMTGGASEMDVLKDYAGRYGGSFDDAMATVDKVKGLNRGKMYQVDINADPEHFLDWDKPLSEQQQMLDAFNKVWSNRGEPAVDFSKMSPNDALNVLERHSGPELASEELGESGIPGIKYLDQGSRPPRSLTDTQASIKYYNDMLAKEPNNQFAADQLKQYQGDLDKYDKGSRNYVVFNDKLIDILKKYGIAGLPAAGVAAGAMQSQPNPADIVSAIRGGQ